MTPGWQLLLDRIESETDPVRRANLEVIARHVVEEVAGNMPALMATLVPDPHYSVWGASDSVGPSQQCATTADRALTSRWCRPPVHVAL
jgi:hypothetical protein